MMMNRLKQITLILFSLLPVVPVIGTTLVRDGVAVAEIVIPEDPVPQVSLAATELRDHIRKISGGELQIVTIPSGKLLPIYVGESPFTRELGVSVDDIEGEVYRIVVTDDYVVLIGHDEIFPFCPPGYDESSKREELQKKWEEFAGAKWEFPFLHIYDPRNYNREYGFSIFDPSGTLFAVYEFLEQLGVRWYMPHHDFGTVIPEKVTVEVADQDEIFQPVFERRYLRVGWGSDRETFLWSKRQRLGLTQLIWNGHGTSEVTRYMNPTDRPELFAFMGGEPIPRGRSYLPRLAEPLEEEMAAYADAFFRYVPEMPHVSVGPADAFTSIDERDVAAGWLREDRGQSARMSDYVWSFIDSVSRRLEGDYPDKTVMGLAYSYYRLPPEDIEKLHRNVGVTYCQHRSSFYQPEVRDQAYAERKAWKEMMQNDELYLWEYYLWHRGPNHHSDGQLWGVPVIFWGIMQDDARELAGVSKGEYIEAWPLQSRLMWGINHMTMYLQARLYWDPNLDRDALLDEYYQVFYGPAAEPMREFFEFAESVWMRPDSRRITAHGGFLRPADVERYFEILERARAAAGDDSDYAKRVNLIYEECQPMLSIWDKLVREGPAIEVVTVRERPVIDGILDESTWRAEDGTFSAPSYRTVTLKTGEDVEPATTAMVRWAADGSGLFIAVSCEEPNMANLRPSMQIDDSVSIYDEDFVEIFIERPDRSAFIIVVNQLGTTLTRATDAAVEPGDLKWNPDLELAVSRQADRWEIEMFIPLESLDNAPPLDASGSWGVNICRSRFVDRGSQNSAIAPTGGRFFTPNRFGSLILIDAEQDNM